MIVRGFCTTALIELLKESLSRIVGLTCNLILFPRFVYFSEFLIEIEVETKPKQRLTNSIRNFSISIFIS